MAQADLTLLQPVSDYLFGSHVYKGIKEVVARHELPAERVAEFFDLIDAVVAGTLELPHMGELISEAFGVDAEKAKRIAIDLTGHCVLPLERYMPGIAEQLTAWGSKAKDFPEFRVERERLTLDAFAGHLTEAHELTLTPQLMKRLGFLIKSYVDGAKSRDATAGFFQRPAAVGGLGLTSTIADKILADVDTQKNTVELVDALPVAPPKAAPPIVETPATAPVPAAAPAPAPEPASKPVPAPVPPVVEKAPEVVAEKVAEKAPEKVPEKSPEKTVAAAVPEIAPSHEVATTTPMAVGKTMHPLPAPKPVVKPAATPAPKPVAQPTPAPAPVPNADTEEIAQHEKMLAKKGIVNEGDTALEAALAVAVEAAAPLLATKKIEKKVFADLARLAVKGVREPFQTRGLLERDLKATGEDFAFFEKAIKLGFDKYHAKLGAAGTPNVAPPAPAAPAKNVPPQSAPPTKATEPKPAAPAITPEQHAMDTRFAAVAGKMPTKSIEPVLPSARVSAARTKDEEVAAQLAAVDEKKLEKAAEASKPAPAKAMLTVGSVAPQPGEQKTMTDVQFRPKLVGPVEELGIMTPADFRRLSSNPADAAKKVDDILTNLESTSYEERIRGVQAWRRSPINVLYAQMAADALQEGVALAEIASQRRNKGLESLSPAEMKAIATINARIQF